MCLEREPYKLLESPYINLLVLLIKIASFF
jgi:hypothetical protein